MRHSKTLVNWYVADFETTSKVFYDKYHYTKVWLWAICDRNAEIVEYGDSIESFMKWLEENSGALVYFHNLKFDGSFILNYLLKEKFKYNDKLKLNDTKGFTTLIGDMGEFYQLKINFASRKQVTIQDSLKIIPLKVEEIAKAFDLPIEKEKIDYEDYVIDDTRLEYIYHDVKIVAMALKYFKDKGFNRMTIGSNAYNSFKTESKLPSSTFPNLDREWLEEWRGAYRGGRSQVNPRYANQILHDVRRYDINSMYPYTMVQYPMPFGKPIECSEPGLYRFELYDIDIDFDLKKGHLPTLLKTASMFNRLGDSYYKNTDGIINIKISNIDYELMTRHYDINYIKFNKIYGFKTRTDIFKEWVMKYYNLKSISEGGLRLLYKLIINNLYGKFGSRSRGANKVPVLTANGISYTLTDEHDMGLYYLPVAIAVTSYAHMLIDNAIMLTGYDKFVYCDTDSVHTLGTLPNNLVDNHEIGKFKLENTEKISKYIRQKCYIYKEFNSKKNKDVWNITCAGMNKGLKDYMVRLHGDDVINEFKIGLSINEDSEGITRDDMKLRPMQVLGGCVLAPVPFSLN